MKKFWNTVAAMICVLILAAGLFTACRTTSDRDSNTGSSSTEQTQPGDNSDSDEPSGSGDAGSATKQPTREQFQQAYSSIGDTVIDAGLSAAQQTASAMAVIRALSLPEDEIYTEQGDSQWAILASAYIFLTAELYKNDSFVITDAPVALTCTYFSGNTQASVTELYLSSAADTEAGTIVLNLDFTTKTYTADAAETQSDIVKDENLIDTQHTYVYVSANYDFASNTVNSVLIHMWMYNYESLISTKFSDDAFLGINANYTEQVTEHVLQLKEAFTDTFGNKVQLGDFSEEVTRANDYMFDKIAGN